ncbi:hypothetical protein ACIG0D_27225 [Streptomyces sp. NPDC052773]|uniref:hypothetical protein n=1 Tax=Streptomyces sp. NPDC052773 TaxID=3365693 RepID=UPI0037D7740C
MTTSSLPAAIASLLGILESSSAPALANVTIVDGPPADDIATQDFLAVGWSGGEDQSAELVQDFNAAGARTRDEEFTIACVIDVWNGDDGFAEVRNRAFAILGVVEAELRATAANPEAPTLNGAVLWAHLTRASLRQYFTDQGARVALGFTVSCHARI